MQEKSWPIRAADPTLKWAARSDHGGGIPRRIVIMAVGAFAKVATNVLNSTEVHNSETLRRGDR
ncbi:uncharacterized protein A4U43_C05F31350 [Asparagus officinalis]|uniref:Uncharacterized protein n=1 Tax=Asparagus officinalis TaxID=4686 RepID=A0A5P1EVU9_ASPOF|nr:uncharacterized protein A4U43_C05F31350 [Asparagus officinalis]